MATTETRLLLLGAVAIFEPVNGYQIRRELVSWHVEEWANINPGSIYNGLATLARRGDLVRHDLRDGTRDVAVYELSDQGRDEFRRLFHQAITEVRATAPLAFQTAMSMLPLVDREEAKRLLAGSNLPVAEIARRTGFSGAGQFSTRFRACTGRTPTAFRGLAQP